MFEHLRNALRERKLNKEMIAFDARKDSTDLYGKWVDGKRVYSNGCYSIPIKKIRNNDWEVKLYTKNGKEIGEYAMSEICDWHHEFVMIRYHCSTIESFYDCDGNRIFDGTGVFITDKEELGENLYLAPIHDYGGFILYNHKTRKFVSNSACKAEYTVFDGVKGQDGKIIGVVECLSDGSGYGSLNDKTYYDMVYTIDYNGNICDIRKENFRKKENGKEVEENSNA